MKHSINNILKRPFWINFLIIIIFLFIIFGIYSRKKEMPNKIKGNTNNKTTEPRREIPREGHLYGPTSYVIDPAILQPPEIPEVYEYNNNYKTTIEDEIPPVLEGPLIDPLIPPPFEESAEFTDNDIEKTPPPELLMPPAPDTEIEDQTEKILENIHDRPEAEKEPSVVHQPPEEIPKKYN